jgi:hypothetical protein
MSMLDVVMSHDGDELVMVSEKSPKTCNFTKTSKFISNPESHDFVYFSPMLNFVSFVPHHHHRHRHHENGDD